MWWRHTHTHGWVGGGYDRAVDGPSGHHALICESETQTMFHFVSACLYTYMHAHASDVIVGMWTIYNIDIIWIVRVYIRIGINAYISASLCFDTGVNYGWLEVDVSIPGPPVAAGGNNLQP